MKIFRQSLRSKLIGVFLLPTLLIVSLYGVLAYSASRQGLEEELGKRLMTTAAATAARMSEGFDAKQIARLDETKARVLSRLREDLETTRAATNVRRMYIFDRDRRVLVGTDDGVFGERLYELGAHRAELDRVFDAATPQTSVLFEGDDGLLYKTGFAPITSEGEVVAAIGVEASAEYFALLTNFASALTALGLLSLLLVVVAATIFSRRLVEPLNRLVDAARRLGRGEMDEPVRAPQDGDEIAFLGRAFEEMRKNIVDRDRQMQMMLSGIAHEVRNPLGGMELFCGLLAEDLEREEHDEAERIAMLDRVGKIQRELDYLERVVNDFLDFARDAAFDLERFSGADFLAEVEDLLRGEVTDAGCALTTTVEPLDVELTANRQKLRRAIINVVRNAYQACAGEGAIDLSIIERDAMRIVRVVDDGPGIPDGSLEDVFTPFFTTKEKGSGLGLALSKRIVEQHGGRVVIDTSTGGTALEFELPFVDGVDRSEERGVPEGWLG